MNQPVRSQDLTFAPPLPPGDAAIVFERVTKSFATRPGQTDVVTALSDLSLSVSAGSILGVIGRSGAGKSTLVRLVNGLEKPTTGRVRVNGVDVAALSERKLRDVRRDVGMIFQHFNLLSSRTVFDNVALPLEISGMRASQIRSRVAPLLDLVGLTEKRDRYPAELSGGQKQRVGIARALATNPKILLSDEATSALDPETTRSILSLLSSINRDLGLTILLITHEMSVIRAVAKEVAVIEGGRIIEHGDVFDVFTRPQHATTRAFVAGETGRALPDYLKARLRPEPTPAASAVLRILFRGPHATDPVLSQLSRDLGIDLNILSGSVDEIAGRPFGTLVIAVPQGDVLTQVRAFLSHRDLDAEVMGYVA